MTAVAVVSGQLNESHSASCSSCNSPSKF